MKAIAVIPTYNEAENLARMAEALFGLPIEGLELLIVDDNSPDGTGRIADELAQRYEGRVEVIHRPGKMGLGTAYVTGFKRALQKGADYVIEIDADFSHPPEKVVEMLEKAMDYDVVVGSRYAPGGRLDGNWGWHRELLSRGGNLYARLVTGLPVRDTTGGFKCFRREALAGIDLDRIRSQGFAFQVEMAYACHRRGYRVAEVPIVFKDRTQGTSKMSSKIILEAAWRVLQLRWRY